MLKAAIGRARVGVIGGTDPTNRNLISGSNVAGIYLLSESATGNVVQGNFIGTDITGTKRLGNQSNGVVIASAAFNTIGGTNAGARNVISGNNQSGIYLTTAANSNWVAGNYLGTDVTGNLAVSNAADGITIYLSGGNLIGGTNSAARNVISGNGGRGIYLEGDGASSNLIQGNFIGTTATGLARLGNGYAGVDFHNASSNTVGGTLAGARNVISGNALSGVSLSDSNATANVMLGNYIGTDATGTNALGNLRNGIFIYGVASNLLGGTLAGAGNVISGNWQNGIEMTNAGARANQVLGNLIGTDATGLRRLSNGFSGITLEAPANFVGGASAATRNVISGNGDSGVFLFGLTASNNIVQGNYIGTTINGNAALSNEISGVEINAAPGNQIGGTNSAARNVISGNFDSGVFVIGTTATNNIFQGNFIGTDLNGAAALPNGVSGVEIDNAPANVVGGSAAGAGNLDTGIYLTNAPRTQIQGNRVGTDVNGTTAIANQYGGVYLISTSNTLVGGTSAGAGNQIAGNVQVGISLENAATTGNTIQGNLIGTKADGVSALPNALHNIEILNNSSSNIIGGVTSGAGNVIAFAQGAGYDGVRIRDGSVKNLVRGNSFFSNGGTSANGLAIDLGTDGPTANDSCDGDSGGNNLQNYPVLTSARGGSQTVIQGTLNSTANTSFLLQFYASPACDSSTYGEGRTYLGEATVKTPGGCSTNFTVTLSNVVAAGSAITATATDPANNTSEFSQCVSVIDPPAITTPPASRTNVAGTTATFTVLATGAAPLAYQWRKNTTNNLVNGGKVGGATTNTLTLTQVAAGDAANYTVVITNSVGSVTSVVATLTIVPPPVLGASFSGGQLQLTWPGTAAGFTLQETGNLSPPISWSATTNVPALVNGQYQVNLTPGLNRRFYRLSGQLGGTNGPPKPRRTMKPSRTKRTAGARDQRIGAPNCGPDAPHGEPGWPPNPTPQA